MNLTGKEGDESCKRKFVVLPAVCVSKKLFTGGRTYGVFEGDGHS